METEEECSPFLNGAKQATPVEGLTTPSVTTPRTGTGPAAPVSEKEPAASVSEEPSAPVEEEPAAEEAASEEEPAAPAEENAAPVSEEPAAAAEEENAGHAEEEPAAAAEEENAAPASEETASEEPAAEEAAVEEEPAAPAEENAAPASEEPADEEAAAPVSEEPTAAAEEEPAAPAEETAAPASEEPAAAVLVPANAFASNATATPNYNDSTQTNEEELRQAMQAARDDDNDIYFTDARDELDDPSGGANAAVATDEVLELEMLRQDNEVLKSVIRRSKDATALNSQVHANIKLQSAYEAKCRELKREAQLRRQQEANLAELKNKSQVAIVAKTAECKKYSDLASSLRIDNETLREKSREQDAVIHALRKEIHRLTSVCKAHGLSTADLPPDYGTTIQGTTKPTTSPLASKSLLTMSPTNFRKEVLKVNVTTSQLNATGATKGRSQSPANPEMSTRSVSPGGVSASGMPTPVPHPFLEINQRVSWKGMQGTVRYIGEVEPLGEGVWVGLELQEGRGEHSGLAFGKRYFAAPARSSVFVHPSELGAGRKIGYESVHSGASTARVSTARNRSPQPIPTSVSPTRSAASASVASPKGNSTSPRFKSSVAKIPPAAPVTATRRVSPTKRIRPTPAAASGSPKSSSASGEEAQPVDIPTAKTPVGTPRVSHSPAASAQRTAADEEPIDGRAAALAEEY